MGIGRLVFAAAAVAVVDAFGLVHARVDVDGVHADGHVQRRQLLQKGRRFGRPFGCISANGIYIFSILTTPKPQPWQPRRRPVAVLSTGLLPSPGGSVQRSPHCCSFDGGQRPQYEQLPVRRDRHGLSWRQLESGHCRQQNDGVPPLLPRELPKFGLPFMPKQGEDHLRQQ